MTVPCVEYLDLETSIPSCYQQREDIFCFLARCTARRLGRGLAGAVDSFGNKLRR